MRCRGENSAWKVCLRQGGRQTHHYVDLFLDLGKHGLVGDGYALEDVVGGTIDGGRGAHEVDMCKATFGDVSNLRGAEVRYTDLD